ncbi:hypothetical protein CYMTET_5712 [Cymbomonas tetramitiformis]|uniref:Uncharacterized protein n=1 Tax=Cymbomonas tetramitiformis TaxID=36881 RepID=A0AAE0GYM2_9CHLO|nr:hypothetical protein CYMTET_5712 [Cymbomonas tetramitiformis]
MFGGIFGGSAPKEPEPVPPGPSYNPIQTIQAVETTGGPAGSVQNFPFQIGGASGEMCNALVAAAGDPACSEVQRRRRVLHCLDLGVPVDYEDPDGVTGMLAAAVSGHTEVIKILLEHGADTDFETARQGGTGLIVAAAAKQEASVDILCQCGATVDFETKAGRTAMLVAASKDHLEIVDALLNFGADLNYENKHGQTPLLVAVDKSLPMMLQLVLERGAIVNKENKCGDTALLAATRTTQVGIMSVLLDGGADVNLETLAGLTPIIQAVLSGRKEAGKLLVSRGAKLNLESAVHSTHYTPLMQVALAERMDAVELLVDLGADPNLELSSKTAALHETAAMGLVRVAQTLVHKGADPNLETSEGLTPLMRAAAAGQTNMCDMLISSGAKAHLESKLGRTALGEAAAAGQLACVSLLLNNGAQPRHINYFHRPPLPLHRYFYTATTAESPEANALQHAMAIGDVADPSSNQNQLLLHRAVWGFIALANQALHGHPEGLEQLAELGEPPQPSSSLPSARFPALRLAGTGALGCIGVPAVNLDQHRQIGVPAVNLDQHRQIGVPAVANGASLSVRDKAGKQPIDYAANNPELEMVLQLLNSDMPRTANTLKGLTL